MAAVTAGMVKELRETTGAGMMDCKKALAATDGDMDKAVEFLREKGLAGAEKKAGRIAAEGIVATALTEDEKKAVVVEVNAETDFVAKNAKFQAYVAQVAAQALTTTAADMDAFMEEKWAADESLTVKEALSSQISIIGENMNIRRFKQVVEENGVVVSYIHAGGRIGVLVDVETSIVNDAEHPDGSDPERSEGSFQTGEGDPGHDPGPYQQRAERDLPVRPDLRKGRGRKAVRSSVRSSGRKRDRCKHHC